MNTTFEHAVLNGTTTRQVASVQETKDYARFSLMELNRNVNRNHVERLKRSFERDYLLAPILVNEHYEIVDGQHRFAAAKEMGLPIRYVVAKGYTIEHVKMLNHEGRNWNVMDHFMSYVKQGAPAYVNTARLFDKFEKLSNSTIVVIVHKFSTPRLAAQVVYKGAKRLSAAAKACSASGMATSSMVDAVKSGAFNDSGVLKAEAFLQWVSRRAEAFPAITNSAFLSSLMLLELYNDEYDRDRMAHSIDNYHAIMSLAPNKALAERQLEEVYNYKRHNRVRLARV
jgi:hypothetical protein